MISIIMIKRLHKQAISTSSLGESTSETNYLTIESDQKFKFFMFF